MERKRGGKNVVIALLLSLIFPAGYLTAQSVVSILFSIPMALTGHFLMGNMLLVVMIVSGAITVAAAVITIKLQRQNVMTELRMRNPGGAVLVMALVLGVMLNIAGSMILALLPIPQWMTDSYNSNVADLLMVGSSPWLMIFTVGIFGPIVEEVAIRAMPLRALRRAIPAAVSAVIGGVLFAVIHMNLLQILYVLPVGIIFCFVYVWTESIYATIALHIGYNGLSAILSTIAPAAAGAEAEEPAFGAVLAIAVVTSAICAVLVWAIHRRRVIAIPIGNNFPEVSSNNMQ